MAYKISQVSRSNLELWDYLKNPIQKFANQIKKSVSVWNAHRNSVDKNRRPFSIVFWGYPEGRDQPREKDYTKVFGQQLQGGQENGYRAWDCASCPKIMDDKNPVAILDKNILYILFDLPHSDSSTNIVRGSSAAFILTKILDEAAKYLVNGGKLLRTFEADTLKRKMSEAKDRYIEVCLTSRENTANSVKSQLADAKERKKRAKETIITSTRTIAHLEEQMAALAQGVDAQKKRLAAEFELIKKLPHVEEFYIEDNEIVIHTDVLTTQKLHDGTVRKLGKYEIFLNIAEGHMVVKNMTRTIKGYPHPHADQDGVMCLGNIEEDFAELIGKYEIAPAVEIAVRALQTVNQNDELGISVYKWPKINSKS